MKNIFHKKCYLTDEERKKPLKYFAKGLYFTSNVDLSEGVEIYSPYEEEEEISIEDYTQAVIEFWTWWQSDVLGRLNGFNGYGSVKWKLVGLKIINS